MATNSNSIKTLNNFKKIISLSMIDINKEVLAFSKAKSLYKKTVLSLLSNFSYLGNKKIRKNPMFFPKKNSLNKLIIVQLFHRGTSFSTLENLIKMHKNNDYVVIVSNNSKKLDELFKGDILKGVQIDSIQIVNARSAFKEEINEYKEVMTNSLGIYNIIKNEFIKRNFNKTIFISDAVKSTSSIQITPLFTKEDSLKKNEDKLDINTYLPTRNSWSERNLSTILQLSIQSKLFDEKIYDCMVKLLSKKQNIEIIDEKISLIENEIFMQELQDDFEDLNIGS